MVPIDFHDINFWIGDNNLSKRYSVDEEELTSILDERGKKYRITGTTVTHFNSLFYYPSAGNDLLSILLEKMNNVPPSQLQGTRIVFGAMLLEHESITEPKNFENSLIKRYSQGFRLLRLFPKTQKYPYVQNFLKRIFETLDHYSFPVMISLDEIDITGDKAIEWEKLLEISDKFKNIPLIIDGGDSKELMYNSYLFALLKNSSNILLNTHNLFGINQIEDLVLASGPDRILFDSYFPYYEAFLSVERILESGLKDEEKTLVAGRNIEKLYSGIKIS